MGLASIWKAEATGEADLWPHFKFWQKGVLEKWTKQMVKRLYQLKRMKKQMKAVHLLPPFF